MANGQKRAKLKKVLSPTATSPPPPQQTTGVDDDLLDDLLTELDSRSPAVQQEAAAVIREMQVNDNPSVSPPPQDNGKKGSKQRFKEREQRKVQAVLDTVPASDPEADARLEREAKHEEKSINATCSSLGLQMFEIPPDGHCLFSAVADQLSILGILAPAAATYKTIRLAAADYMYTHQDDFLPFLPSLDGEDGVGSTDAGLMTPAGFKQYCQTIRDTGMWGGEPEIMALSRAFNIPIHVVQAGPPPVVKHSPIPEIEPPPGTPTVFISYHRRMYGLGEHYNSLRPKGSMASRIMDKLDKNFSHLA